MSMMEIWEMDATRWMPACDAGAALGVLAPFSEWRDAVATQLGLCL